MPILLKNLIVESVTVKVAGAFTSKGNIKGLAKWLHEKVIVPIEKKLSTSEMQGVATTPIYFSESMQRLYVYIGTYPESVRPRVLGGISHMLNSVGVETKTWWVQDTGSTSTVVIEIIKLTADENPPTITMSGGALEKIKSLLSLGDVYDGPGGALTLSININTLEHHLDQYLDNVVDGLAPQIPNHQIRGYLQQLKHLIAWARKNDKNIITGD